MTGAVPKSKAASVESASKRPAKPITMDFELLDRYLLSAEGSKIAVVDALLQHPSDDPAAAPFYRALRQIGPRAADEALIALRLVLAGKKPVDEKVRALRDLIKAVRGGGDQAATARDAYFMELR